MSPSVQLQSQCLDSAMVDPHLRELCALVPIDAKDFARRLWLGIDSGDSDAESIEMSSGLDLVFTLAGALRNSSPLIRARWPCASPVARSGHRDPCVGWILAHRGQSHLRTRE